MFLRNHPLPLLGRHLARPVRAMYVAGLVAVIGTFVAIDLTTTQIAHAFGLGGSLAYWTTHAPLQSIVWLALADRTYLGYAAHHRAYPASEAALLAHYHDVLGQHLAVAMVVAAGVLTIGTLMHHRRLLRARFRAPDISPMPQFSLHIGTSTGRLIAAGHGAGVTKNQPLVLVGDDAAQSIVAFGATGSGKTTGINLPLVAQSLAQDGGIFAFDVKGDYGDDFCELARRVDRDVIIIGARRDGGRPCNVLHDLSPEMAASFLKSAFLLAGSGGGNSAYWVDLATELSRNVLGVLSYFPEHYSLYGLYEYVFVASFRARLRGRIAQTFAGLVMRNLPSTDLESADRLATYAGYYTTVFEATEPKTRSIILSQLSTVLSPFTMPELRQAFCEQHADNVDLRRVIDGDAILVRLPLARYGLGAKTAYTLLKLRFFDVMKNRALHPAWNQTRYVVFVADEYQEVVSVAKDALSDLNFWDKSRSSRCVGIISTQGHSSFRAAIGSDALTASFLQNFRQQITFRTEDEATIKHFVYLLGQVEVEREGHSRTRSARTGGGPGAGASISTGTSSNRSMRSTIDPQTVRNLAPGEALAVLSIRGAAYDDVIVTQPLYVRDRAVAVTAASAAAVGAVA